MWSYFSIPQFSIFLGLILRKCYIIIHFLLDTLSNENYIANTNIFKMMLFMQLSSNFFELHCYVSNFIYNNQACIYFYVRMVSKTDYR